MEVNVSSIKNYYITHIILYYNYIAVQWTGSTQYLASVSIIGLITWMIFEKCSRRAVLLSPKQWSTGQVDTYSQYINYDLWSVDKINLKNFMLYLLHLCMYIVYSFTSVPATLKLQQNVENHITVYRHRNFNGIVDNWLLIKYHSNNIVLLCTTPLDGRE